MLKVHAPSNSGFSLNWPSHTHSDGRKITLSLAGTA